MTIALLSENFLIIHNLKKIAVCQIHYQNGRKNWNTSLAFKFKKCKETSFYLKKFKKCLARDDSEFCYIFNILVHLNLLHNSMNNAAKTLKFRATQRAVLSMI